MAQGKDANGMDAYETALELLPERWGLGSFAALAPEEIRLRLGRSPSLLCAGEERGSLAPAVTEGDLLRVLERASGASLHAAAQSLSQGYIGYKGLRIGVCGAVSESAGGLRCFRHFSSLAIRIPSERRGVCDRAASELWRAGLAGCLILSPPGGGKTTALRELIRALSDKGVRVCVCDERNELAAYDGTLYRFPLGTKTDILTDIPKAEGAMMLLRTMNPQVIAMDEITRSADIGAITQISGCGVTVLATAHAASADELHRRLLYRHLLESGVFAYALTISQDSGKRRYDLARLS